jgi:hypothetical protein
MGLLTKESQKLLSHDFFLRQTHVGFVPAECSATVSSASLHQQTLVQNMLVTTDIRRQVLSYNDMRGRAVWSKFDIRKGSSARLLDEKSSPNLDQPFLWTMTHPLLVNHSAAPLGEDTCWLLIPAQEIVNIQVSATNEVIFLPFHHGCCCNDNARWKRKNLCLTNLRNRKLLSDGTRCLIN